MDGFIFMWSGSTESLPEGVYLCNGAGGRPDLRNRFIKGTSDPVTAHTTGGSSSRDHTHTIASSTATAHAHSLTGYYSVLRHEHLVINVASGGRVAVDPAGSGLEPTNTIRAKGTISPANHHGNVGSVTIPAHSHTVGYALSGEIEGVAAPPYYRMCFVIVETPFIFPSGAIVMWSGSMDSILMGWALCDGTNGTPDLSDKMVKGASTDVDLLTTGGAATHTHVLSDGAHTHGWVSYTNYEHSHEENETPGDLYNGTLDIDHSVTDTMSHRHEYGYGGGHSHSVTIEDYASYPPYYNLAFIMKL